MSISMSGGPRDDLSCPGGVSVPAALCVCAVIIQQQQQEVFCHRVSHRVILRWGMHPPFWSGSWFGKSYDRMLMFLKSRGAVVFIEPAELLWAVEQ